MPEGLEAEIYRRGAERCAGRTIESVAVDENQASAEELRDVLPGLAIIGARRHGKLVVLDLAERPSATEPAVTLGLHFGMTGRLVVDGESAIEQLEYASGRDDPAWDRFVLTLADGGVLRINDPRRWARFELDPDVERLGPDFLVVTAEHLAAVFARRRVAVKAVLLDQAAVAGYGNMCVDEVLFHAGISPLASARTLTEESIDAIVDATRTHLPAMLERGGSHTGTIDPEVRAAVPPCPRDGGPMRREQVGGRTTIWCPIHQLVPNG